MKRLIFITLTLLCLSQFFAATDENVSGVDRYAIYIGSNKGGKGREQLLYAGSDAQNFKNAMSEIGGVTEANSFVLIDPTKERINATLNEISRRIVTSESHAKRSEFIFYYSGHSDENSLLLGDVPYDYSALKAAITEVPSDIHVVILDSCYSGNFIRTKGGQKRKPFLIDDSSVVTGHAYLSSSSTNEYSQESDEIESSYFTNAMITGLRGAADTSGDNKVTLNELYSYAFNDTLSKTEDSKAGPQHPNYNITLVGSGDLILSDISSGEAMLSLSKEAKGKFIIRDADGKLISEINKIEGQPIFMALPAAQYSAVIIDEYSTKQGYFILEKDQIYVLDQNSLSTIKRKSNRLRGGNADDEDILPIDDLTNTTVTGRGSRRRYENSADDSDSEEVTGRGSVMSKLPELEDDEEDEGIFSSDPDSFEPFDSDTMRYFRLHFVPGLTFVGKGKESTLFSIGIIGAKDKNIYALQYSTVMNIATGTVTGVQEAGVFNIAGRVFGVQSAGVFNCSGDVSGVQAAGVFNTAKDVKGLQAAGVFNVAEDVKGAQVAGVFNGANEVDGVQVGLINYAEKSNGIAIGLINIIKDGMHHIGFTWDSNGMFDLFFQTGTKNLFVTIGTAFDFTNTVYEDSYGRTYRTNIYYAGLGTEFRFGVSSLDLEFLSKAVINEGSLPRNQKDAEKFNFGEFLIPSFRVTFNPVSMKHIDVSVGASFDFHYHGSNDRAFDYTYHRGGSKDEDTTIYPAVFLGFKIK